MQTVELEQVKQLLEHTGPQVDVLVSLEPLEQVTQVVELVQTAQLVMHGTQLPLSSKNPGLHREQPEEVQVLQFTGHVDVQALLARTNPASHIEQTVADEHTVHPVEQATQLDDDKK